MCKVLGKKREDIAYKERKRVTAIILNDNNKIALINLTKRYFHMLPGGGIDEGEGIGQALLREAKEETGADIEIISNLGEAVEYLDDRQREQITYFYLTKAVGKIGELNLTQDEIEQGHKVEWYTIEQAIEILSNEEDCEAYLRKRELFGLKEAKRYLDRERNDIGMTI